MKATKPKATKPTMAYSSPKLTVVGSVTGLAVAASDLTCDAAQCATCNVELCVRPAGPYGGANPLRRPLTLQ